MQQLSERNISFPALQAKLRELDARQVNQVIDHNRMRVLDSGLIEVGERIPGSEDTITSVFEPNDVFVGQLADTFKTGTPLARRLFEQRPDVAADLFNGLLKGNSTPEQNPVTGEIRDYPADQRGFLFRAYREYDGEPATARALLSDRYRIMDNYDVLTAALQGMASVTELEGKVTVTSADLTDRRMFVNFMAPQVAVSAKALLEGYRSPFNSPGVTRAGEFAGLARVAEMMARYGGDGETLFAGFKLSNSEVGDGKFKIVPYAKFRVCFNGLAIEADMIDQVHLGGRLEQGAIDWSQATQEAQKKLIREMTADAVRTFLSADYWQAQIDRLAAKAARPVGVGAGSDGGGKIDRVGRALNFTDAERADIFTHFMLGGQFTSGGVMNAVTSVAQTLPSAERANALEAAAVKVLDLI